VAPRGAVLPVTLPDPMLPVAFVGAFFPVTLPEPMLPMAPCVLPLPAAPTGVFPPMGSCFPPLCAKLGTARQQINKPAAAMQYPLFMLYLLCMKVNESIQYTLVYRDHGDRLQSIAFRPHIAMCIKRYLPGAYVATRLGNRGIKTKPPRGMPRGGEPEVNTITPQGLLTCCLSSVVPAALCCRIFQRPCTARSTAPDG
jgi:hypothetical protein